MGTHTLLISNDAFFNITEGEPCLDAANEVEIAELRSAYGDFRVIEHSYDPRGGVRVTIETVGEPEYDAYRDLTPYIRLLLRRIKDRVVQITWCDTETGKSKDFGTFEVQNFGTDKAFIQKQDRSSCPGCVFYLKNFIEKA